MISQYNPRLFSIALQNSCSLTLCALKMYFKLETSNSWNLSGKNPPALKAKTTVLLVDHCLEYQKNKFLLKFYINDVFTGLKPSRKPRLLPLPLPRHLLRLPLSWQDNLSQRKRSWALTMRSRRTQQTTVKVRATDAHVLNSSLRDLPPSSTSGLQSPCCTFYCFQLPSDIYCTVAFIWVSKMFQCFLIPAKNESTVVHSN